MNKANNITKSTKQIFKDNIYTLFNLFNLIIAIALALVNAWSNMFFVLVILANILVGIIQEIKAKKLVEELSLLSMPTAKIIRDGIEKEVATEEVEKEDILLLESGNVICADSIIVSGELEANESMLTGESDPVIKKINDKLLSGSSVISGKCEAKVIHSGDENYASKIMREVKKLKGVNSKLILSMRKVTKFTGWLIVPLGIIMFIEAFYFRNNSIQSSVISTSAGLLGMLPKGLVLLISIGLATGVIRLSKKKVLVQDIYSLENLAHVDVICLDKTGTLTEGKMKVENMILFHEENKTEFTSLMGTFLKNTSDNNATFQALRDYFHYESDLCVESSIAFSSERKWSSIKIKDGSNFVIGAPERLSAGTLKQDIQDAMMEGKRVLLAGKVNEINNNKIDAKYVSLLAAIIITDPIRENATNAISYFHDEGVNVKVISGDNPITVSAVAKKAGIINADKYIDMSQIKDEDIPRIANENTVFGRVNPKQKKAIVKAMQIEGHSVAMTGDGVNDLLAMKQADCSIAVDHGSDAARQVAQVVLLNSDFSVLKDVLAEGRRVINNITKSAGVFFIKTIYSILLCILCVVFNMEFPFIPIQVTLIDLAIEGYPSFFLSFEPNDSKVKGSFLNTSLKLALPNAIAITLCCIIVFIIGNIFSVDENQISLIMYLTLGTISIGGVIKSCMPFNKLRLFLAATTTVGYFVAVFLFHSLLKLPLFNNTSAIIFVIIAVFGMILTYIARKIINSLD